MDELEPWGVLKSNEFSREWLWIYLNHMRENTERLNEYLAIADIPPLHNGSADSALSILKNAKITDDDVKSISWDVLQLSKHVETEEDLYSLKEFKKLLIITIVKNKLH